jgi:AbrB family looped-hinge helix DNA binding protein
LSEHAPVEPLGLQLPAKLRRRLGIEEGSFVVAEERDDGILIRPAAVVPLEIYTPERRAEFLLNNALSADDYRRARAAVKRMDLDPDRIKHHRPPNRRE